VGLVLGLYASQTSAQTPAKVDFEVVAVQVALNHLKEEVNKLTAENEALKKQLEKKDDDKH
jgi:cell division protein FtsB